MNKDAKIYVAGHRGMVGSAITRELRRQGYNNLVFRTHAELDLTRQEPVEEFFEAEKPEYVFMPAGKVGGIVANSTAIADFMYDMDAAVSIERRLAAMKQVYDAGIRTVCFISPVFPGLTDIEGIIERAKDQCDQIWLENLNLRGGFKADIMSYISEKHPDLMPLYDEIYNKKNRSYFEALEKKAEELAERYGCRFVDNETPYERVPKGHPTIVNYFYHEEVRGTGNSGKRNK